MTQFSTFHESVSCDGCMTPNFSGNRYKCLRCWDFDLCHACFIANRFVPDPNGDQRHEIDHPMQCILTHADFELVYCDNNDRSYDTCRILVLTCPYCGRNGLSARQFYSHVMQAHPDPLGAPVNCPLCIGLMDQESNRVVDNLASHWATVHFQYDPVNQGIGGTTVPPPARSTLDLPPTRTGARRPMMARRTQRQNAERDRERPEAVGARAAAAAFGMPWPNDFEDVNEIFRIDRLRGATGAGGAAVAIARADVEGRTNNRQQRLRNLAANLDDASNTGRLQQLLRDHPAAAAYAGVLRGLPADAGEYAAPRSWPSHPPGLGRDHAGSRRIIMADTVPVLTPIGSRPLVNAVYDDHRVDENGEPMMGRVRAGAVSPCSTLTSGSGAREPGSPLSTIHVYPEESTSTNTSQSISGEAMPDFASSEDNTTPPPTTAPDEDSQNDSEDEYLKTLTREEAIALTTMSEEEIIDRRRSEDPFAGRILDPMTALRANTTDREWTTIRRMMRSSDISYFDNTEEELCMHDLRRSRPAPATEEESEDNGAWLTVQVDTSGLPFANDSYWKDKRFIRPRKLERQQSSVAVDQAAQLRRAQIALQLVRTMADGKVLSNAKDMKDGAVLRKTLEMFDFTQPVQPVEQDPVAKKTEESMTSLSAQIDADYESAMTAIYQNEMKEAEKMMAKKRENQEVTPSSANAREIDDLTRYIRRLRVAELHHGDSSEEEEEEEKVPSTTAASSSASANPAPPENIPTMPRLVFD